MKKIRIPAFAGLAMILCMLFCLGSCKTADLNTTAAKTGSPTSTLSGKAETEPSSDQTSATAVGMTTRDPNGKIVYHPRTAEEWGVEMPKMKLIPDDPYSVRLNEIYNEHLNTKQNFIEAFTEYENNNDESLYALYDLDGEGTKELITGWNCYEGDYVGIESQYYGTYYDRTKNGRKKMVTHVYSVDANGNAVEWQFYENAFDAELVNRVILTNGTIKTIAGNAFGYDDHYSYQYVKLDNGEIVAYRELFDTCNAAGKTEEYKTRSDRNAYPDEEISKEEFDRYRAEWETDNPEVTLDWNPIYTYGQ
ncbi:MAG: hypothetical protein IJK64_01030 [Clostridia bacterium]|nr:hypothetical protein [Clostridia bacterium]